MSYEDRVRQAIKDTPMADKVGRGVLKVLLGEFQLAVNPKAAKPKPMTDEQAVGIIKKMIESNEQTIKYLPSTDPRFGVCVKENEVLQALMPVYLTDEQIRSMVAELDLKSPPKDGQAIGVAMKLFKEKKLPVDGTRVKAIVEEIRRG